MIPDGETFQLIDIGTHSKGAIFLDGGYLKTPTLESTIDAICQRYQGFNFGRFDIRVPSANDLREGRNIKIIELTASPSEATSIYDPKNSVFDAYRVLFEQWRIAFEIGDQNHQRGTAKIGLVSLIKIILNNKFGSSEKKSKTQNPQSENRLMCLILFSYNVHPEYRLVLGDPRRFS